jgi:hypothetical protein
MSAVAPRPRGPGRSPSAPVPARLSPPVPPGYVPLAHRPQAPGNGDASAPEPFEQLHFAPAPAISGPVPGVRSQRMLAEQAALESRARSYPRAVPVAFEEGRGATLRDVDGNTYIDFFAGAGALNLGHGHPEVARAPAKKSM